jgi:hypothetical protein
MVAIWMGTSAFNMPSCIRPVSVRYCETSKSKLRHWRSPLALASIGTAPISVAMWVSCELRRRSPRSCSLELACRDRPEGKVPHVSTLCSESELFDTALENCRAQTGCIPDASDPRAPAPVRYACARDPSMVPPIQIPSIPLCESRSRLLQGIAVGAVASGRRRTAAIMTPSNYSCPACNAKLLKRQRGESAKPGEQAFCPHCMAQLPARDGPYTLGYELVEAPPRDR